MRRLALLVMLTLLVAAQIAACDPTVTKTVKRKVVVAPQRGVLESKVYLTIEVEGNGTYTLEDFTYIPGASNPVFYGVEPEELDISGGYVKARWSLSARGERVVGYVVDAEPLLVVDAEILVDGDPARLECFDKYCVAPGAAGVNVTYRLTLRNNLEIDGSKVPLAAIVTMTLSHGCMEVVDEDPEPGAKTEMGEALVYTWFITVEDEEKLVVKLRVKCLDSWGEAVLPDFKVLVPLNPEQTLERLSQVEEELEGHLEKSREMERYMENMGLFFENFSRMFDEMGARFSNFSNMLGEGVNKSLEAADALENASLMAYAAADKMDELADFMSDMSAELREVDKTVSTALRVMGETEKALNEVERYVDLISSYYPGDELAAMLNLSKPLSLADAKGLIKDLKARISSLRRTLKSYESATKYVGEAEEEFREAAEMLRTLGDGLYNASVKMRELASILEKAKKHLDETAANMESRAAEIKSRMGEFEEASEKTKEIREELEEKLEELRATRRAVEKFYEIYRRQEPVVTLTDGSSARSTLLTDEVSIKILTVKLRETIEREAPPPPPEEAGGLNKTPVILAAMGGAGWVALSLVYGYRRPVKEGVEELEKILKELEELEGER